MRTTNAFGAFLASMVMSQGALAAPAVRDVASNEERHAPGLPRFNMPLDSGSLPVVARDPSPVKPKPSPKPSPKPTPQEPQQQKPPANQQQKPPTNQQNDKTPDDNTQNPSQPGSTWKEELPGALTDVVGSCLTIPGSVCNPVQVPGAVPSEVPAKRAPKGPSPAGKPSGTNDNSNSPGSGLLDLITAPLNLLPFIPTQEQPPAESGAPAKRATMEPSGMPPVACTQLGGCGGFEDFDWSTLQTPGAPAVEKREPFLFPLLSTLLGAGGSSQGATAAKRDLEELAAREPILGNLFPMLTSLLGSVGAKRDVHELATREPIVGALLPLLTSLLGAGASAAAPARRDVHELAAREPIVGALLPLLTSFLTAGASATGGDPAAAAAPVRRDTTQTESAKDGPVGDEETTAALQQIEDILQELMKELQAGGMTQTSSEKGTGSTPPAASATA